jgi:hypothetical protein
MRRLWTATLGLLMAAAVASQANASIIYEVFNPSANFVFFIYDSPQFITTDTLVPGSSLAFNNSVHPATSVDFIISSPLDPGYADVQITIDPLPAFPPSKTNSFSQRIWGNSGPTNSPPEVSVIPTHSCWSRHPSRRRSRS